jgi:hypothetical protein
MKLFLLSLLVLLSSHLLGQKSYTIASSIGNEFQNWTYHDFIKNDVKKIEAYSYNIKKNGKVSKDSLLLYKLEFNKESNKVFGRNCHRMIQTNGPIYLSWYTFQTLYNKNGNIIEHRSRLEETKKTKLKSGKIEWDIDENILTCKYDSVGNLIDENDQHFKNHYSVYRYSEDTAHLRSVQALIYEYNYNEKGQRIGRYFTWDSMRYLPINGYTDETSFVTCMYCKPRYLSSEYSYNESGKLKVYVGYSKVGEIHSKTYYYYDHMGNKILQVDSTGWDYKKNQPKWESTTTYDYDDSVKVVTTIYNTEGKMSGSKERMVTIYNDKGHITKHCALTDSLEECTNHYYTYDNGKLISDILITNDKVISETYFRYTSLGLLYEEKVIKQNKITQLIRYYYE